MALQNSRPNVRVAIPHPHDTSSSWQGAVHHMPGSSQQYHLGSQNARASWDLAGYLDHSPATAGGGAPAHPLSYGTRTVADLAGAGLDSRTVRSLSSQQQSHQMPQS
jgi:hypothetical protein